jgi:hypothetical protein
MAAALQVCTDYHVFGCTYQIENMATLDLEHLATAPYRFSARLRTEFGLEPLKPMLTQTIRPSLQHDSNVPSTSNFHSVKIVPGGRFAVTCAKNRVLQLWDLGFPNASPSSLPLATTQIIHQSQVSDISIQPTPDQSGILVLVTFRSSAFSIDWCVSFYNDDLKYLY